MVSVVSLQSKIEALALAQKPQKIGVYDIDNSSRWETLGLGLDP